MEILRIDLNKGYSEEIAFAVEVLKKGGVIIYPTDTLYGIGANALNLVAVEKIFDIKGRDSSKPIPILARNIKWVKEMAYVNNWEKTLEKIWPGKVTAVLEKRDIIPNKITAGGKTVGIRIADHPLVDKILAKFGYPLTSSSANISGQEPTNNIDEIISTFEGRKYKPDLVLDVGTLPKSDPSVVVDFTSNKPKILRVGPSKPEQLMKILEI